MKKVILLLGVVFALFLLQGIWIHNSYKNHTTISMKALHDILHESIQKEVNIRTYGSPKNFEDPQLRLKYADQMAPEEINQHKGDTLHLGELAKKGLGNNLVEFILQLNQDQLIDNNNPLQLYKLDSIFQTLLETDNIKIQYCISTFNQDTLLTDHIGTLNPKAERCQVTQLFPIGIKARQFVQVKANIPMSAFLQEMLQLLIISILLVVIVILCVIHLVITIRRKDQLFKQREASVNGTVHDLKAPLNSIITLMSFIRKKLPDEGSQSIVAQTMQQTKHLVSDIESLLITARRDRQQIILQKEDTDLIQLVLQVQESLSTLYTEKPHSIQLNTAQPELMLLIDPLYITNVIRNLLENALKYSNDGVEITILIHTKGKYVLLEVKDNGWGIEKKYQKKIFDQFFQVPRAGKLHQRGYGVGLAYTHYIMAAHGGKITVTSESGKGSTFTCFFPLK